MKWNEETPKYRVGDLVEFRSCSSFEKHVGRIVKVNEWSGGDIRYDIKSDVDGEYYRKKEKDIISYTPHPSFEKPELPLLERSDIVEIELDTLQTELLKRVVNDYHYGLYPELYPKSIYGINTEFNKEEKNMDIRVGDVVGFRYVGEWLEGYVKKISVRHNRSVYVDIDCGGGGIITCYPVDNIVSNSSAEKRREVKLKLNSLYGANEKLNYLPDKEEKEVYTPNIKISQTEITGGDRKGIYSTVFFNYANTDPVTIKKSEDANNDILLAIAYANAIRYCDTNSKFKKRVDKETIKMGNDYAIQLDWRNFFIPGEILKRKRWDIYTYVAVQLLFRTFSIKDIQEAIENCTYTKKEK